MECLTSTRTSKKAWIPFLLYLRFVVLQNALHLLLNGAILYLLFHKSFIDIEEVLQRNKGNMHLRVEEKVVTIYMFTRENLQKWTTFINL